MNPYVRAQKWALVGALSLLLGAGFLYRAHALVLRLFGLVLLGNGARAVRVGVELQAGADPSRGDRLLRLLVLSAGVLVTMAVARLMGSWR
jgi:hypothetical protein